MSLRSRVLVASVLSGVLLTSACATFADQPPPESWRPQEQLTPQGGPDPEVPGESRPGEGGTGDSGTPTEIPPPDGCKDYDPAVIATCLDTVVAVAAFPGDGQDPVALVGERRTGRILRVKQGSDPQLVATVPVDGSGDGGLTGLALSPTYAEDQLIFAYITTPTDNRVVRIAPGDVPKPVITGIPRGATDNRGALAQDRTGALLLATGDAGNAQLAGDLGSLAGKVLRFDASGAPAPGNPTKTSLVVASGLRSPGGVCTSVNGPGAWVTDRAANQDVLFRLELGKPLTTPAWTWPDRPGVSGCAAMATGIVIVMSTAGNAQRLPIASDGSFSGKPEVTLDKDEGYGLLGGMDAVNDQVAVVGTLNKDGGRPVSSDDRAIVVVLTGQKGSGVD
ncbi:PQQ-dependent sugar dehydrogenase [Actinophytocola sp.]|uniref:PQQ-dependent sugar dehydrogenase n=1 Tax=Actinophytocola sp. TaxID=1872138 RepID=UPI002D50B4EB|nr:PQQ-dependent sugar dehydrogenase [Actinophytocola sp.]HYQ62159.1 PQQ-dependent sugar dehydrogenase [Actinophytocola sp.]